MKSEWMVTSNVIDGEKMYAIYRLLDTSEVDHSGNREFAGGFILCKETAAKVAEILNKEAGGEAEVEAGEEKKTCYRCGKPMEEFAVAWGWECCYECSFVLRKEGKK